MEQAVHFVEAFYLYEQECKKLAKEGNALAKKELKVLAALKKKISLDDILRGYLCSC